MTTALVLTEASEWNLRIERQERERRAFASERVCDLVAMALVEGAEYTTRRMLEPVIGYDATVHARSRAFPGYTFIRNFLVGELDADPVIAARAAAKQVQLHNRLQGYLSEARISLPVGRESGWL
jgi:hypothetical protein